METSGWALLLLSSIVLLVFVFGIVVVIRLSSIEWSLSKIDRMLEYKIEPQLRGLASKNTMDDEIRAVRQTVSEVPMRLERLSESRIKSVGEGVANIAKDVSLIKTYVLKLAGARG